MIAQLMRVQEQKLGLYETTDALREVDLTGCCAGDYDAEYGRYGLLNLALDLVGDGGRFVVTTKDESKVSAFCILKPQHPAVTALEFMCTQTPPHKDIETLLKHIVAAARELGHKVTVDQHGKAGDWAWREEVLAKTGFKKGGDGVWHADFEAERKQSLLYGIHTRYKSSFLMCSQVQKNTVRESLLFPEGLKETYSLFQSEVRWRESNQIYLDFMRQKVGTELCIPHLACKYVPGERAVSKTRSSSAQAKLKSKSDHTLAKAISHVVEECGKHTSTLRRRRALVPLCVGDQGSETVNHFNWVYVDLRQKLCLLIEPNGSENVSNHNGMQQLRDAMAELKWDGWSARTLEMPNVHSNFTLKNHGGVCVAIAMWVVVEYIQDGGPFIEEFVIERNRKNAWDDTASLAKFMKGVTEHTQKYNIRDVLKKAVKHVNDVQQVWKFVMLSNSVEIPAKAESYNFRYEYKDPWEMTVKFAAFPRQPSAKR